MNILKSGSFYKLLAFALLVLLIVFFATVAVNGKEGDNNQDSSGDRNDNDSLTDTDGSQNPTQPGEEGTNGGSPVLIPKFTYYLTGLECDEADARLVPFAVITSSDAPAYAISSSQILIEIPIENGKTRFLSYYTSLQGLGKIGALDAARDNILSVTKLFGGISVAFGNDDIIVSSKSELSLDIKGSEYYYIENARFIYTGADKLRTYADASKIQTEYSFAPEVFKFVEHGECFKGIASAKTIILPYSDSNRTSFVFDRDLDAYRLQKSGADVTDMLTAERASFENVFVLFADSTTYEKASGVQTVIDTTSSGSGYYFSGGLATEIRWQVENGNISFTMLDGTELSVNRGKTYIGYYKSSSSSDISFE